MPRTERIQPSAPPLPGSKSPHARISDLSSEDSFYSVGENLYPTLQRYNPDSSGSENVDIQDEETEHQQDNDCEDVSEEDEELNMQRKE